MENIKIAVQAVLTSLKAKSDTIGKAIETAKASNKDAILSGVEYAVSDADGVTASGCGKEIDVGNYAQLIQNKRTIDCWVSKLSLAAQEQIEVSGAESEQLSNLLASKESPTPAKAKVDVSVYLR